MRLRKVWGLGGEDCFSVSVSACFLGLVVGKILLDSFSLLRASSSIVLATASRARVSCLAWSRWAEVWFLPIFAIVWLVEWVGFEVRVFEMRDGGLCCELDVKGAKGGRWLKLVGLRKVFIDARLPRGHVRKEVPWSFLPSRNDSLHSFVLMEVTSAW